MSNRIIIEEKLSNPILFSYSKQHISNRPSRIVVRNAELVHQEESNFSIVANFPSSKGTISALFTVEVWINKSICKVKPRQKGTDIYLLDYLTLAIDSFEVKVVKPVLLEFPEDYESVFSFALDIGGIV